MPADQPRAIERFAVDVRLGLAMVPGFAPVGWDAADYERHLDGGAEPLAEVLAWHREHWPEVRSFADFIDHLHLTSWEPETWAALIAGAGAVGIPAPVSLQPPFREMRLELDRASRLRDTTATGRPVLERGLGPSTIWNQAETDDDRLDGAGLVALLAELASLGMDLTLVVGPLPDGSIPRGVSTPLVAAGRWLATDSNADAIDGTDPFDVAGDDEVRYTARPGREEGTREVFVIDLAGAPVRELAHFSPHRYPILAVDGAATWDQGPAGVRLVARPQPPAAAGDPPSVVHRLVIVDKRARSLLVQGQRAGGDVRIGDRRFPTIGAALAAARAGDLVDVPPGRYAAPAESFPLVVPPGVTVIGQEPGSPTVDPPTIEPPGLGAGNATIELRSGAALAGLTITQPVADAVTITSVDAIGTKVERCTVEGVIAHQGGADHVVAFCTLTAGSIRSSGGERITVTGNRIEGPAPAVGVVIEGGADHRVDANTITGLERAIALVDTVEANVSANAAFATREAIRLDRTENTIVTGNQCRGGRAVTVAAGHGDEITANIADRTDTGLLLIDGAVGTMARGNRYVGCRVGILAWSHEASELDGNHFDASRDHDIVA